MVVVSWVCGFRSGVVWCLGVGVVVGGRGVCGGGGGVEVCLVLGLVWGGGRLFSVVVVVWCVVCIAVVGFLLFLWVIGDVGFFFCGCVCVGVCGFSLWSLWSLFL